MAEETTASGTRRAYAVPKTNARTIPDVGATSGRAVEQAVAGLRQDRTELIPDSLDSFRMTAHVPVGVLSGAARSGDDRYLFLASTLCEVADHAQVHRVIDIEAEGRHVDPLEYRVYGSVLRQITPLVA